MEKYGLVAYPEKSDLLGEILSMINKEEDPPLVRLRKVLPAGFSVIARMPYVELDVN